MKADELKAAFDQQAAGYDQQWARLAPIRESLHFLLEAVFAQLPENARILTVGVGTGAELGHLAKRFARARFVAVEPSGAMLDLCRERARQEGFFSRCEFHEGYVETLPGGEPCHAATSLLVSQFILDKQVRVDFFRAIAARMIPGGILATSDLASEVGTAQHEALVGVWMNMMAGAGIAPEALTKMREAWNRDVAMLPPAETAAIIEAGGFDVPTQFHQAGLIHAWFARRRA
jgi:tRNA (cmo5U34)-methyltransferase